MRIKRLSKQYEGKTVVDSVSFEIPKGKVISLIGPNCQNRCVSFFCNRYRNTAHRRNSCSKNSSLLPN